MHEYDVNISPVTVFPVAQSVEDYAPNRVGDAPTNQHHRVDTSGLGRYHAVHRLWVGMGITYTSGVCVCVCVRA